MFLSQNSFLPSIIYKFKSFFVTSRSDTTLNLLLFNDIKVLPFAMVINVFTFVALSRDSHKCTATFTTFIANMYKPFINGKNWGHNNAKTLSCWIMFNTLLRLWILKATNTGSVVDMFWSGIFLIYLCIHPLPHELKVVEW